MNAATRLLHENVISQSWVVSTFLKRAQLPLLAIIAAVLTTALGVIYMTNITRTLHANIQHTFAEREHLHVQWGQLLLERSTWIMQARIQNLAEGRLGMLVPDVKAVVVVHE